MEACRLATLDDVPAIVAMARALRHEVRDRRGGPQWTNVEARPEPLDDAYRSLLGRPDTRLVVGTIEGVPLGFAVGELASGHDGTPRGRITDLYADPDARSIGLGEAMIEPLLEWFAAHDCSEIDALALPGDRMTKNFFEDHGFVSRALIVSRRLTPRAEPEPE